MRIPFRARNAFLPALLVAAGLGSALAAGAKSPSTTDSAAIVPAGMHAHKDCMADSAEMGKLRQTVQEALKSGDKAKMKGALEKVDAHLAKMQDMMEQCKAGKKGAMMDHEGGMMCGKDHEGEGAAKGANPK